MNLFDPAAIVNAVLYVDYTGVPGSLGANEQIYMNMTIN